MGEKPTFKDIVELAKAGYKPGDVKEIIEAASKLDKTEDVKSVEETAEITPKEDVQPEPEKAEKSEAAPGKDATSNDEIENLQKQVKELTEKLKKMQETNTKKDLQGNVQTTEEKLNDIARSFM